ncbi:MAG: ribosome-binding factor A [Alphaproteobacteria bacterium]|jgi:ribosome-binding factor A
MKKGKSASRSSTPSQRQYRVGEELRHALARILEHAHFRDPDLSGVSITVSEVRISPDLRNATAFITPLGGDEMPAVVAALNRAAGYFRGEIAREIRLRHIPKIDFEADTSFAYSSHIDALLARPDVARDIARKDEAPVDADDEDNADRDDDNGPAA